MRFVHIADMHFDIPFTSLNTRENLGEKRRMEQRHVFSKVIDYVYENEIPYLFISGDLYEHQYVKKSTIEFISREFDRIPNTKVFISPGNHDPYLTNSYYSTYEFGENVYIFRNFWIEKYEDENVNIYGMAFNDFYMDEAFIDDRKLPYSDKINILLAHIDLNGSKDKDGMSYNPVAETKLASKGFDYCAIGHIHKRYINTKNRICYPGSTISLGFDELGEHGMLVGDITKSSFDIEFIPLDEREFKEIEVNATKCESQEDLAERIITYDFDQNGMYKVILKGDRKFEINTKKLLNIVAQNTNVMKIKDNTKIVYDIESIAKENNLKGIFVRKVIETYREGLCTEEECQKAIEIGLDSM